MNKNAIDYVRSPAQLGNAIRRARKKRGLSQTDLGKMAGLRQATISIIETGNPAARIDTILEVLAVLDLEIHIANRNMSSVEQDIEDLIG